MLPDGKCIISNNKLYYGNQKLEVALQNYVTNGILHYRHQVISNISIERSVIKVLDINLDAKRMIEFYTLQNAEGRYVITDVIYTDGTTQAVVVKGYNTNAATSSFGIYCDSYLYQSNNRINTNATPFLGIYSGDSSGIFNFWYDCYYFA